MKKKKLVLQLAQKENSAFCKLKNVKKEILFMTKLLEQNGNVVNSNWGW